MSEIKCGDHIHHKPSGEDWVVAYVNNDHLVCQGWPESSAKLSDCVLIKSCSFEEHIASLEGCAKSSGSRAYHAQKRLEELAKETWPEEVWLQPDTIFYPSDDEDGYAGCSVAFSADHGGFKYVRSDLVTNTHADLVEALEMVRDADEDCKRDDLQTIPPIARAKIDAALAKARGEQP